ncbi:MAG: T9SS type A sorting domain-containing protein [Saprospiraceae bacterium]
MYKNLLFVALFLLIGVSGFTQGTVFWSENFDGVASGLPAGWSQLTSATDGGWKTGTTTALSSTDFPVPARAGNILGTNDDGCNCNKANEILYLPTMDFSTLTDPRLLFDIFFVRGTFQSKTESLRLLASIDNGSTWTEVVALTGQGAWRNSHHIPLTAYAGKPSVRLAFRYDDGTGWLFGAMLDNMRIVQADNIVRARVATVAAGKYIDAVPAISTVYDKVLPGAEVAVRGTFVNSGFPTVTSFDVVVTRNGSSQTLNYTNLNLLFNQSLTFYIPYPTVLGANMYDFSVEIKNVNGVGDNDPSDNVGTATYSVTSVLPQPNRKVVIEEGTGTWCTWCPRGAVMMDYIADKYPNLAIPIAVHNAIQSYPDPMQNFDYNAGMVGLIGGFPGGRVEREADIDPLLGNPNFEKALITHLTQPAKAIVSQNVDLDVAARKVDVTTSIQFVEAMSGDLRVAVAYIEDGVKGSTQYYNQINAYAGGGQGPMGNFHLLPSPVPASQMVYDHVAREIVGGFTGAPGSVPASNAAGSVMSYKSTYTVPATFDISKMHAISMLIDAATNRIINAEITTIPFVSTSTPTLALDAVQISIFPNPVQDEAMLTIKVEETADVQIRVVDALGRVMSDRNYASISGKQLLPFRADNLPNGMYTLVATANGQVASKSFVVQR